MKSKILFENENIKVIDRVVSHIHDSGNTISLLKEVIENRQQEILKHKIITIKYKFDRIIGDSKCVETTDKDEIIFAKRPNRQGKTRFVLNKKPVPCDTLIAVLKRAHDSRNTYICITSFVGFDIHHEPWDKYATSEDRLFWLDHAIVMDSAPLG